MKDPEVKKLACLGVHIDYSNIEKLIQGHSSWYTLKCSIAWLLRLKQHPSKSKNPLKGQGPLTVEELKQAQAAVLRYVQHAHFSDEASHLSRGNGVSKSSKMLSLDPIIGSDHLI